jgi:RNA polymerase sigma-70 factor (ECF subfamily)
MITKPQRAFDGADDLSLVHFAKRGDMAAFEELIKRHTMMIFRVATHLAASAEDAEEVVQDAFLKAFHHLQHFEERARFSTWLTRIAINEALARRRRSRRCPTVSIEDEIGGNRLLGDGIADWRSNPEQIYNTAQLREILQHALATLPDASRVVFLMRDVEGLSTADTAELLGLSVPSVKARLLRAR